MASRAAAKGFRKGVEEKIFHGILKTHIPAGMASGSPPLGTQLGQVVSTFNLFGYFTRQFSNINSFICFQRGVNIPGFVKDFNERTKNYKPGVPIPSIVEVKPDRSYKLTLQLPPFQYYLFQAAGIKRGAMQAGKLLGATWRSDTRVFF